jgi:hypothetical protein
MKLAYLDLSNGHLTEATFALLGKHFQYTSNPIEVGLDWPAMTVVTHGYGVFMTVPYDYSLQQGEAVPEDLARVLAAARLRDATLIRFDVDGDVDSTLPYYEW